MEFLTLWINSFTFFERVTAGATLLFFLVQLVFYFFIYRKPYSYEKKRQAEPVRDIELPSVSVIISSKNESEALQENLPFILDQDHPNFEVIVVNSGSTDETDMVLKAAENKYPNLYHTYVPAEAEGINERKLSLTLGIKAAKNDVLLFTDAYCKPCSNQWIREMSSGFKDGKEIVLGYCKLIIDRKKPMRNFILYDNLMHNLKFLSMAIAKKPFMGIGRNLAYKKELFFKHKGFSSVLNVEGGEDDLFINKIANGKNTVVCISPRGMTETQVVQRFFTWRAFKSKYLYTKQFYKGMAPFIFGCETFSKYAFYIAVLFTGFLGIVNSNYILPAFATFLFLIRFLLQLKIMNESSRLFDAGKYHINLLAFDIFQPFNNFRFRKYANKRNRATR